jgi:putative heme transporter
MAPPGMEVGGPVEASDGAPSLDGAERGAAAAPASPLEQRAPGWVRKAWPVARIVIGFGLVALAVWVLSSKTPELTGIGTIFKNFDWWWIIPAVLAEIGSYLCFSAMQYELLMAGHLRPPWTPLVKLSFASQAITNSLPIGNAVATVYGFRWFRRFGADNTLAVWALAGSLVAASVSLSLVAVLGLAIAADQGASLDLVPVLIGTFAFMVGIGSLFVYERPLHAVLSFVLRVSVKLTGRPRGDSAATIGRIMAWMTAVRLSWRQIGWIVWWGTVNWLLDCACFAMMFRAINAPIPWAGLLLAYGAGQLAATLPITPGGLGVVEGSITVALVAFGGAETSTVNAVLLYRLISFWFILAVGWLFIGQMALQVRRGRWSRSAMTAAAAAGPVAYVHPSEVGAAERPVPAPAAATGEGAAAGDGGQGEESGDGGAGAPVSLPVSEKVTE